MELHRFGAAGAVLPLLPTTPFLLVAAWAASKSSPRLERWLEQHPLWGPSLRAWRTQKAISRKAKGMALSLMAISWLILWLLNTATGVLVFTGLLMSVVGVFLLTRPCPSVHD